MNKRELGIEIITHAEAGFLNVHQMLIACATLALRYGDRPYRDNKRAIQDQLRKYDAEAHALKKTDDPRKIDTRIIERPLGEMFADADIDTPGEIIGNIITYLAIMLGFYRQVSIYGSQLAVGAPTEEVLETKINDLADQYNVTMNEINKCLKVAPLLYEVASVKEFEKNSMLNELDECKNKLFS